MTVGKEIQVARYIRAYHKQTEQLAFEILLPPDCLTFLSTVDFLHDEIDPLLYGLTELDADQTDLLHRHFFIDNIADTDYFDYFLECDSVPQSKVKTQEELFVFVEQDCIDFVTCITGDSDSSFGVTAAYRQDFRELQELLYKIYQQGVQDGRL